MGKDHLPSEMSHSNYSGEAKEINDKFDHRTSYIFHSYNNGGGKKDEQHTCQDNLHLDEKCPHPGIEMPPVRETHKRCRKEKDEGKDNAVMGRAQKFTALANQSYKEENERAHHKPCRHVGKWGMKRKTIFMFL